MSEHALANLENLNKDVLPTLGGRSIYGILRHDLLDLLSRFEQRKALTTAEKCRTWFNQLFRYALVKIQRLEHNPASDLDVVALPKPPVSHALKKVLCSSNAEDTPRSCSMKSALVERNPITFTCLGKLQFRGAPIEEFKLQVIRHSLVCLQRFE
ncbi:phage integrase central domain-containing protein [Pseudomonas fluorescens]|uniref:phage integrase central domain-containing protein n=1 Tax=Pseudomonas fluorescens TaxID=294 RepID=UPI00398FFC37